MSVNQTEIIELALTPRPCPACDEPQLSALWSQTFLAETRGAARRFDTRVAQCPCCGFVLTSPAPTQSDLDAYYADHFAGWHGQSLDYSVPARAEYLRRHVTHGSRIVEVGGASEGAFWNALQRDYPACVVVQPNSFERSNARTLSELVPEGADAIVHYYVLEHIRDVEEFLTGCAARLVPGGVMVCEVPDLCLYSTDASGLALYEHQNHFTVETLARVAARAGFTLIDASHAFASRPFGVVSVFRRQTSDEQFPPASPGAIVHARACVDGGVALIRAYEAQMTALSARLTVAAEGGAGGVVWAANDVLRSLIDLTGALPAGTTIVDSDPAKQVIRGLPVVRPEQARQALRDADLVVICSELHRDAIVSRAVQICGDPSLAERVEVISSYDHAGRLWWDARPPHAPYV